MSTLPVTVSPSRPPSHQPPEDRYRIVLLYIETLALIVLLGVLIFILGNWVLPTSSRNIVHFGVLFGTSAVALLGSILSAIQARRLLVQVFHLFLHIPVLVELRRIAYVTVVLPEWTFSNGMYYIMFTLTQINDLLNNSISPSRSRKHARLRCRDLVRPRSAVPCSQEHGTWGRKE